MAAKPGMAGPGLRKFTFAQRFDLPEEAVPEPRAAEREEAARRRQEELDAARQEGFAAGHAAGLEQARAEIGAAIAACLDRVSSQLAEIGRSEEATGHLLTRQSIEIARAVAVQLASRLMEVQPQVEVEALVADCLAQLRSEPQVVVALSPPLAEVLQERLQEVALGAGFGGRLVVQADPHLDPADARLTWSQGSAVRSRQEVLQEIENAVQRYLHGHGLVAPGAAAAV